MNFLKGVLGFGKKARNENEFLEYKGEGRLFLVQKRNKKCVFILASISFIQGKRNPWERFIFIKNLSEESEFNTNEYYFVITPEMNFRTYQAQDEDDDIVGFEWDIEHGAAVCFEFGTHISDDLSGATDFRHYMCKLLFENKHEISSLDVPEEELEDYCMTKEEYESEVASTISAGSSILENYKTQESQVLKPKNKEAEYQRPDYNAGESLRQPVVVKQTLEWNQDQKDKSQNQGQNQQNVDDLARDFEKKMDINKGKKSVEGPVEESKTATQAKMDYSKVDGKTLIEIQTNLCELSETGQTVVLVPKVNLLVVDAGSFKFYLEIFDEKMNIIYKRQIQSDLNYHVDEERNSFKWVEIKAGSGDISVYSCTLPKDLIHAYKLVFAQCLFETANQEHIESVLKKSEERDYARKWFENDVQPIQEIPSQENDEMEIEDDYIPATNNPAGQNTGQVQAKVLDRSFVSKGSKISVFMANDDDNSLEHIVTLPPVKTFDGIEIHPKKMMMHEQDTKVLMLSDPSNAKVYYMDLAKGKIVNEFEGDGSNRFTDMAPVSKHSGFTHNPCFITANPRNLFLIDPRIGDKNKIVAEKIYAQAPQFSCIATNGIENAFATGSDKGEIRLYKEVGQNAKTLFPGLGDPILSLDSTLDAQWLLATTKTYLMLIQTIIDGKNGYKISISKERRTPFRLTILPQDMKKYKMTEVDFQTAKFNDNENLSERCIVASTGPYLITWNLKHVLRGQTHKYEIKRLDDYIVSNEFRYKRDDNLLVTMPKDIRVQKARFHN